MGFLQRREKRGIRRWDGLFGVAGCEGRCGSQRLQEGQMEDLSRGSIAKRMVEDEDCCEAT